jgi:hypothetical protein
MVKDGKIDSLANPVTFQCHKDSIEARWKVPV